MAINVFNMTADHSTTNRTSSNYPTATLTFVAGRTYLLGIRARVASGTPGIGSVANGGGTWTLIGSVNESNITIWLYWMIPTATTTASIAITPDGITTWTQAGWTIDEVFGAPDSSPIVQYATAQEPGSHSSLTVTLSTLAASDSGVYGFFAQSEDSDITPGSGFTGLGASTENTENANRIRSIWGRGDTTVDVTTSTTTSDILGIAVEISTSAQFPSPIDITNTTVGTATNTHTLNYPATVVAGDLLLTHFVHSGTSSITGSGGYTTVASPIASTSLSFRPHLLARVGTGSEGGSTTNLSLSGSRVSETQCLRIEDWGGDIATDIEYQVSPVSAINPNVASFSPSWGAENTLWVLFLSTDDGVDYPTAAPSGYVGLAVLGAAGGASKPMSALAWKTLNASSENPGTFTVTGNMANSVAVLVAIRMAALSQEITLGAKIATAESFGTATLRATINPSAIATGVAFGTHELQAGASNITPDLIASAEAFGSHELLQISVISLQGNGIASEEAFGTHELQPGAVNISPDAIATAESFGTHSLQAAIRPDGIISAEVFGTPYFISHISPSGIATVEAFGTVILLRYIRPGAIGTGESFGTAELQPGTAYISPSAIATLESFGLHRLAKALAGRIPPPPGLAGDGADLQPGVSAFRVNPPSGQSKSGLWLPPGV